MRRNKWQQSAHHHANNLLHTVSFSTSLNLSVPPSSGPKTAFILSILTHFSLYLPLFSLEQDLNNRSISIKEWDVLLLADISFERRLLVTLDLKTLKPRGSRGSRASEHKQRHGTDTERDTSLSSRPPLALPFSVLFLSVVMKFCWKEADAEEKWTDEAKNVQDDQKCDYLSSRNQSIWRPKKR